MLSAAPACAEPTFLLTQTEARAGDTVEFTIAGAKKHVSYDIEVAGREVLEGSGSSGGVIVGQFTMPDLGASSRAVTVEAEIDERHGTTVARRKLQYLLPAPQVSAPPASEPAPAPVPLQQATTPAPEPTLTIPAAVAPTPVEEHSAPARPRAARDPRATGRTRGPRKRLAVRKTRAKHPAKHRTKRRAARTAPLFDGLRESSSGGSGIPPQADGAGFPSLNATAPPASVLTAAEEGLNTAVIIPALLALAALAIAGTAFLRKLRHQTVR